MSLQFTHVRLHRQVAKFARGFFVLSLVLSTELKVTFPEASFHDSYAQFL